MRTRSMFVALAAVTAILAFCTQAAAVDTAFPITVSQEVTTPVLPGLEPAGVGFVRYDPLSNLLSWTIYYAGMTGPIADPGVRFEGPASIGSEGTVQSVCRRRQQRRDPAIASRRPRDGQPPA